MSLLYTDSWRGLSHRMIWYIILMRFGFCFILAGQKLHFVSQFCRAVRRNYFNDIARELIGLVCINMLTTSASNFTLRLFLSFYFSALQDIALFHIVWLLGLSMVNWSSADENFIREVPLDKLVWIVSIPYIKFWKSGPKYCTPWRRRDPHSLNVLVNIQCLE